MITSIRVYKDTINTNKKNLLESKANLLIVDFICNSYIQLYKFWEYRSTIQQPLATAKGLGDSRRPRGQPEA